MDQSLGLPRYLHGFGSYFRANIKTGRQIAAATQATRRCSPLPPRLDQLASPSEPTGARGALCLRVATANVLTLKSGADDETLDHVGLQGATRQRFLLAQFHDAGVLLAALQETRVRTRRHLRDPDFVRSPATDAGHFGMALIFNKNSLVLLQLLGAPPISLKRCTK